MIPTSAGYREIEHTADWELEAWAPDLLGLLEQAARGMYALSGISIAESPRQARQLDLAAFDPESLLVAFLAELLYFAEQERLAFDVFDLCIEGGRFTASLDGAPLLAQDKEIKAVTYHNLSIRQSETGLLVRVVFDV